MPNSTIYRYVAQGDSEWSQYPNWLGHFYIDGSRKKVSGRSAGITLTNCTSLTFTLNYAVLPKANDKAPIIIELAQRNSDNSYPQPPYYVLYKYYAADVSGTITEQTQIEKNLYKASSNTLAAGAASTLTLVGNYSTYWNKGATSNCAVGGTNASKTFNNIEVGQGKGVAFVPGTTDQSTLANGGTVAESITITLNFKTALTGVYCLHLIAPKIWTYTDLNYAGGSDYNMSSAIQVTNNSFSYSMANTYSITYNANGHGTAPTSQTKTHGTALTLRAFIANQTSGGTSATGTVTPSSAGTTGVSISGATTGKATWNTAKTTWSQTYWNTNSAGTGTNYSSSGSYTANSSATLYAIWSTSTAAAAGMAYTLPGGTTPTKSNTTATGAKVTFNVNGGTSVSPTSATATNTIKYTFKGWYTSATGGTQRTTASRVTAAETVYPQFTSAVTTGSVTLPTTANTTKATTSTDTTVVITGSTAGTTGITWTNGTTGNAGVRTTYTYTLSKWATTAAATGGSTYNPGASYTTASAITLYARWNTSTSTAGISYTLPGGTLVKANTTADSYIVTYNPNGGTLTISDTEISTKTTPYTFNGWYTSSTGGTQRTTDSRVTAAETVYPQFIADTTIQNAVTLPTTAQCTRANYTLLGFATTSGATAATYNPGASYTPTSDIILYAVWSLNSSTKYVYYHSYVPTGCDTTTVTVPATQSVSSNIGEPASITLSATVPTLRHHTFLGWATSSGATASAYAPGATVSVSNQLDLYPVWESKIFININGNIKQVREIYTNLDGTIKTIEIGYININNNLKQF